MNVTELVRHFVSHSPDFYRDKELSKIDSKHTGIISQGYDQIEKLDINNFRSWKAQNDLACPSNILFAKGLVEGVFKPVFKKIFQRQNEKFLLQALLDDIHIIRLIKAESLLLENPAHLSPGIDHYYKLDNFTVNFRWLRYIYLAKRILDLKILKNGGTWIDIGSYYGGLQGVVRKNNANARIVLVDFHHQLCRSYIYLKHLYPTATHIMPDEVNNLKSFESAPEGSFIYIPPSSFEIVSCLRADLATNFFSFGEMRPEVFASYINSDVVSKSKYLYLVNRFVSSPWFEPTYDTNLTILEYLNKDRCIKYFDIFPMHYYMNINRCLFNRKGFRNISSPYFEYLSSTLEVK